MSPSLPADNIPRLPGKLELTDDALIIKYKDETFTIPVTEKGDFNIAILFSHLDGLLLKLWKEAQDKADVAKLLSK